MKNTFVSILLILLFYTNAFTQGTICTETTTTPTYNTVLTENPNFDWEKSGPLNSDITPYTYDFLYWKSDGKHYTTNPNYATIPGISGFSYSFQQIRSPWDANESNTYDLNLSRKQGILDNLHQEGWEIIQKEFGSPLFPSDNKIYIILYNRNQGLLRILILIDDTILDGINVVTLLES